MVDESYWPSPLLELKAEKPEEPGDVVVAELSAPWGKGSEKCLFTALVPLEKLDAILANPGGIGVDIETNGPRPTAGESSPKFSIWAGDIVPEGLEPLIK